MKENSCYTYFAIKGNIEWQIITARLGLQPTKKWNIGDKRSNGTQYDFALWEFGYFDDYDVLVENQMMKTIQSLIPLKEELNLIKKEYDVSFVLEIVPTVYPNNSSPCLAPNRAVIEFCYETGTDIDIDLYINDLNDEE